MELVSEMPVKAVAELVGCDDERLWRVLHHYVDAARDRLDLAGVTEVGMDETSAARGHDYISLFVDLKGASGPKVVFATEGKDAATVAAFAGDLAAHGGDPKAVTDVTCDMSEAFVAGVGEHLPAAQCVVRSNPDTDSDPIRTPIPIQSGHRFRRIPDT